MDKVKERDIRRLEFFCSVTAFVASVLCILFLFGILQRRWLLNFILGLGVLLHVAMLLLYLVKRRHVLAVVAFAFMVVYILGLVYFNIL